MQKLAGTLRTISQFHLQMKLDRAVSVNSLPSTAAMIVKKVRVLAAAGA